MALDILDAATLAAVRAATNQEAQLAALAAPFVAAGGVTAKIYAGTTILDVGSYAAWVPDAATPRGMVLGTRLDYTAESVGTPTRAHFMVGAQVIFTLDAGVGGPGVSFAAGVMPSAARANLSDPVATKMRITANENLPVNDIPAWYVAMAAGTVEDLTTNTPVEALGYGVNFMRAYSGWAWAPWWGLAGSVVWAGGGHGDGTPNSILRADVATRLISVIKTAATAFVKSTTYVADPVTGWMWANATDGDATVQVGEPFAAHHYANITALPESAFPGQGAMNGWLYKVGAMSMPLAGQSQTNQAHKLRMGVDQQWSAHGNSSIPNAATYGPSCYDPVRNRVWYIEGNAAPVDTLWYRDMADGTRGSVALSGGALSFGDLIGNYRVLVHHAAADVFLSVINSDASLVVFDPATGVRTSPTLTGTAPPTQLQGWAWGWSDVWNALFFHDGETIDNRTIYFLKPTGDPRTDAWAWSSQTVTGTMRRVYTVGADSNATYNRLSHAAALGDALIWGPDDQAPLQVVKLASTP